MDFQINVRQTFSRETDNRECWAALLIVAYEGKKKEKNGGRDLENFATIRSASSSNIINHVSFLNNRHSRLFFIQIQGISSRK